MIETTVSHFKNNIKSEIQHCIDHHEVLKVKTDEGENFIVIGENNWRAIEESVYLNHIPKLVESIHEAAAEPLAEGTPLEELVW